MEYYYKYPVVTEGISSTFKIKKNTLKAVKGTHHSVAQGDGDAGGGIAADFARVETLRQFVVVFDPLGVIVPDVAGDLQR